MVVTCLIITLSFVASIATESCLKCSDHYFALEDFVDILWTLGYPNYAPAALYIIVVYQLTRHFFGSTCSILKKIACTLLCLLFYNLDFTTFSPDKKTILRNIARSSKRGFKNARRKSIFDSKFVYEFYRCSFALLCFLTHFFLYLELVWAK